MKIYTESDILRLGKRHNNKKRTYLLVNPLQAKHIPSSPKDSLDMMYTLGDKLAAKYPDAKLVIGFAETATAIAAAAASRLSSECIYIHTTREDLGNRNFIEFYEEHSHAAEQKLYSENLEKYISDTNEIILIDDEFSTGKTLLNIVRQIREKYPDTKKIIAASIINRLSKTNSNKLLSAGIECEYLVKLPEIDYTDTVKNIDISPPLNISDRGFDTAKTNIINLSESCLDPRFGLKIGEYKKSCEKFADDIFSELSDKIYEKDSVLVLGTEEFMYPAVITALKIQDAAKNVKCHSTTRSPIGINNSNGYPAQNGYQLPSFYDTDRISYIYNLKKYDKVIILTDGRNNIPNALNTLTAALAAYSNENIFFVNGGRNVQYI